MDLPKVKARFGFMNRIIVDKCPYCDKAHYHLQGGSDDNYQRLADCFKGEYILTFEPSSGYYSMDGEIKKFGD